MMESLYYGRSLWDPSEDMNDTLETYVMLDNNFTTSLVPKLNTSVAAEALMANNTTSGQNQTETSGETGVGEDRGMQPRIVGGLLEKHGGSPWQVRTDGYTRHSSPHLQMKPVCVCQVLIHRSDGFGFCGGTLVSDRWVVSAAHCFEESADHVTIGEHKSNCPTHTHLWGDIMTNIMLTLWDDHYLTADRWVLES